MIHDPKLKAVSLSVTISQCPMCVPAIVCFDWSLNVVFYYGNTVVL